jgi:seryl-tRNA synthetase
VEQQSETIVDGESKQKFDAAHSEIDKIILQKQKIQQVIQRFEEELRQHDEHLGQLCLQFQGLALSGSFSGHLAAAIRMFEVRLTTMKKAGSDLDSIGQMEKRIESLRKQHDNVQSMRGVSHSLFKNQGSGNGTGHGRFQLWSPLASLIGGWYQ